MSAHRPAQIFASISTNPSLSKPKVSIDAMKSTESKEQSVTDAMGSTVPQGRDKEIRVTAGGELSLPPDRCRVTMTVSSAKDQVQEAKNSVTRRLDYIVQTLINHQLKESDLNISKVLTRVDGLYHYNAEVAALFVDFDKCQNVCNFLVEKLGDSIRVSTREFFQSPQRLENLRRQTSLLAVRNAKQKAAEIAQFLHASVGKVVSIEENSSDECEGQTDSIPEPGVPPTVQQQMTATTVFCSAKVTVTFELKSRTKGKNTIK